MSRYISIDDLQSYCDNQRSHSITPNEFQRMDSIRIVRCKDCKHYHVDLFAFCDLDNRPQHENWYCADGEPRDGEEEIYSNKE